MTELYDVCHDKEDADFTYFMLTLAGRNAEVKSDAPGTWSVWIREEQ